MWPLLEKISEQVTRYSTFLGQLWYLCVFVFRLIVVVTIGGAVYGDEQSMFKCSTDVVGCENVCFNKFSKISHIRFWAFQLLAVAAPTVFFHFYTMYVNGQIEKMKKEEDEQRKMEEGSDTVDDSKNFHKLSKRRKSIGRVKVRQIYVGSEIKEIPLTRKVHYAYFATVIMRIIIEAVFIYLAYNLFRFMNHDESETGPLNFLWFRVPLKYYCQGEGVDACAQHFDDNGVGHVPCWVSRPWEKTIFLRYMNVFSAICFVLSVVELVYLVMQAVCTRQRRTKLRSLRSHYHPQRHESVFYSSAPHHNGNNFYPSLGVPVRLSGSEVSREYETRPYGDEKKTNEKSDHLQ